MKYEIINVDNQILIDSNYDILFVNVKEVLDDIKSGIKCFFN